MLNMVKPIRFPLEMGNGVKVNTLEELREHFDLERVLGHYIDGKLLVWLEGRYYENEATQIAGLNHEDADFNSRLCNVLGVQCKISETINILELEVNKKRMARLKQYTDDENIIRNIDNVAFNQEELSDLLNNNTNRIYLCGGSFSISPNKENVSYIGINRPQVVLQSSHDVDFDKKNIYFANIILTSDKETRIIARKSQQISIDSNMIKTELTFKSLITTFNINMSGYGSIKIYLYKTFLIHVAENTKDVIFDIFDIKTKQKLISVSDIKPEPVKYEPHYIEKTGMYKNYLIIFWDNYRNLSLQLFNLDKLKVETVVPLPNDSWQNVTNCAFIEVNENQICLYSKAGWIYEHPVNSQYHSIPSLELIKTKRFNPNYKYESGRLDAFYQGERFRLYSKYMDITSTQKTGICEKLQYSNRPNGRVEIFKIINNRIYVVQRVECEEKKGDIDIADITVFSLDGGNQIGEAKVSDNEIVRFGSSKKIVDMIHIDNMLVVIPAEVPSIYFYDESSLELKNKFSLDLTLGQEWTRPGEFSTTGSCEIYDAYIDLDNHRMAIAYNGIIAIYE